MRRKNAIILSVTALLLSVLACTINVGGPDIPEQTIPISTEAITSLEEQMQQARETAMQTGVLTLQISEPQLTSYLAFRLQTDPDAAFRDPQIFLREGQMRVYGKAYQGNFTANVAIILSVGVDTLGQPTLEITSADFGPFPAPQGLRETIQAAFQEAYTGAVGPAATGLRLESIRIADGMMTLSGRVK